MLPISSSSFYVPTASLGSKGDRVTVFGTKENHQQVNEIHLHTGGGKIHVFNENADYLKSVSGVNNKETVSESDTAAKRLKEIVTSFMTDETLAYKRQGIIPDEKMCINQLNKMLGLDYQLK